LIVKNGFYEQNTGGYLTVATSPLQRSKKMLESDGWLVAITEHWNHFARVRQDLFGFVDLLALRGKETLAVQVTSASNIMARVHKITESENLRAVRDAGWGVHIHGWKKDTKTKKWVCRVIDLS
jgi:carbonic anhydrase